MTARFTDQHILVTGGTRGIGRACSLAFLAEGAHVHALYQSRADAADALRTAAGPLATRLTTSACDLRDSEAVARFWAQRGEAPLHALVCSGGIRRDRMIALMTEEEWSDVLETNLGGSFRMAKGALKPMMQQRLGRIVFLTSPSGREGLAGQGNYSASKAGLVALARSLAKEVGKRGITANCVSPGLVETEMLEGLAPEMLAAHRTRIPAGRLGEAGEIAAAVLFLCSAEAAYVNGSVLEVSGGL